MRGRAARIAEALLVCLLADAIWPREVHAYLDPGTGSMLITAIVGIFATVLFLLKGLQYKVKAFILGLFGVQAREQEQHGIVFYSEGAQYWSTFEPIVRGLDEMGVPCVYLTSGKDDPGLDYPSERVSSRYIGARYRAYARLNAMEADVCVMTTPGLDVLQIKRSKGVKHYVHIVHSVGDIGTYKQFAFDYFDTVMTAAEHQIEALEALEALRGTEPKALLRTGCCYMDGLADRVARAGGRVANEPPSVLIAPTWGSNGLFSRFGARLPKILLEAGFQVVIRPHPQSRTSEKELIDALVDELLGYPNLTWDDTTGPFDSMLEADVLVSDLSGIVFDFAFVFGKPVVSIEFEYDARGMEASDLPGDLWELSVVDRIGLRMREQELTSLPERIRGLVGSEELLDAIRQVRDDTLFNPGRAGQTAARQIVEIQRRVARPPAVSALEGPTAAVP